MDLVLQSETGILRFRLVRISTVLERTVPEFRSRPTADIGERRKTGIGLPR